MAYSPNLPPGQATMANSQPVVLASNQTSIPVAATLSAETTKVIGTVNQGTSPWVISGTVTANPSTDVAPATQNVTVIDSGSSTATGANNQTIVIGTPTAGSAASFALSSIETIRVEVTGIWTGTLTAEQSIDGGTTWTSQGLHQGAYTVSSFTAGFIGGANVAGATNFRMRATAAITGTAVVKVIESVNTQSVYIANAAPSGTVISTLNSSTATLTSGSVYTGTGEDVTNFSEMRVSVFSNVASATDGLSVQQSSDNTNWDITDTYTIPALTAGQGKTFVVPRQARYFRVVYTNGGTNQATFRLQTILNRTATAPSSQRAGDAYTNETDLVQNQVFPMGFNGTTWDRLRTVGTGVLKTDTSTIAGTVISVNNGTTDAGTTRVTLSSDSTGQVKLAAGSAVIGHVITDTGSTTAVTGNVTVVQTTGTNLHVVTDSTSTTAVTQATAANLNATVIGAGSAGTANAGVVTVQGIASMTKLLVTPDSVALPANQSVNVSQINAVTPLMGNGVTGTGSQRVTIASDNTAFSVNAVQSGTWTVQPGNTPNSTPWLVTQVPATSGGLSVGTGSIGNTATSVKGSAGQVFGWYFYNANATVSYIQFFDLATGSVTVGTTAPKYSLGIPATSGANVLFESGIAHGTAITIAITTTRAGSTSPGSTVDYNVFYK